MKKIMTLILSITFLLTISGSSFAAIKYKIYKANKHEKVEKYRVKLQKHYNDNHIAGTPWIISCPVVTWEGKYAVPLVGEGTPANDGDDGDDGDVDNIDRPVEEEKKK